MSDKNRFATFEFEGVEQAFWEEIEQNDLLKVEAVNASQFELTVNIETKSYLASIDTGFTLSSMSSQKTLLQANASYWGAAEEWSAGGFCLYAKKSAYIDFVKSFTMDFMAYPDYYEAVHYCFHFPTLLIDVVAMDLPTIIVKRK